MRLTRLLAGFLFLAASMAAFGAASVAERSPFKQGHWWDPSRSGAGFDIFSAAGQVMVVWYTYDEAGRATWYTAQGEQARLGTDWPLQQHRWADGRLAGSTTVGALRMQLANPEAATLAWTIAGHSGTSAIVPLVASGVIDEVDYSGAWFDPNHSGWGINVTQQGDVLGGVLFTYDASGAPTWFAGFERASGGTVPFYACSGTCPWCPYRPIATTGAGTISFEFKDDWHATLRNGLHPAMAPGVVLDGVSLTQISRPASWRTADRQLARFDADAPLKAYLDAGMMNVRLPESVGFSAGPPAIAFSATNVQEAGVDEADLVKSDGRFVYTFASTESGGRQPVIRIAEVGAQGSTLAERGWVPLASGPGTAMNAAGLYLAGNRLVAVTGTQPMMSFGSPWVSSGTWLGGVTGVEVLDTASAGAPVTRWRAQIDGHLVSSRRIGTKLYVVSRFVPSIPGFVVGSSSAGNQQVLNATPLEAMLPKVRIDGGPASAIVGPSAVYSPPQGTRPPMADMMLVTVVDLDSPRIAQAMAIVGSADTVYASPNNLYVATSRFVMRSAGGTLLPVPPSTYLTDVHQIALTESGMAIVGSASIEGAVGTDPEKAAFRLGEYQGRLRVVTSSPSMWGSVSVNRLTILEPSSVAPGLLRTVSYLPNANRPEPLGKPGEQLYGTRFLDDRLYAVTFKKIDPLYVVDLSHADDPRIAGAIEMPGYSDYLHPLPNGLMLGFGKEAKPASSLGDGQFAWYQGLMLALFDVSDPSHPREMQRLVMGKRGSDSALLRDHHAFSMLAVADGTSTIAIPASLHDGAPSSGTGDSTSYPWQKSGLMRFELRGSSPANATLAELPGLVTRSTPQAQPMFDAGASGGRSVILPAGTVYVDNGTFWLRTSSGGVSSY